jgi:PmbA protein
MMESRETREARLVRQVEAILDEARRQGATAAEVGVSDDAGLSVTARLREVETVEFHRDRGFSVTVYAGQCKGNASTTDTSPEAIAETVARALLIARHTAPDPCAGLAPRERLATVFPDLDLHHPWDLSTEAAIDLACAAEAAALAVPGVSNSEGASVGSGDGVRVFGTSDGFLGVHAGTRHSISVSVIAGEGRSMQRDDWYTTARAAGDLDAADAVGREAGRRAVARVGARPVATTTAPVLLVPEVAASVVGHLLGAISGGALYRRASFLLDALGEKLFPSFVQMDEAPLLRRQPGSAAFDGDGVATSAKPIVDAGVLSTYLLGVYSARRLGRESTGNADGVHNLLVRDTRAAARDQASLLAEMGDGLLVTELMGQGVNLVTGDYSRGAAGYWVERGRIAFPVAEVTIASDLRSMFANLVAIGDDVDRRHNVQTGSMLLGPMTIAGT